jgi:hypothetical protein
MLLRLLDMKGIALSTLAQAEPIHMTSHFSHMQTDITVMNASAYTEAIHQRLTAKLYHRPESWRQTVRLVQRCRGRPAF